MIKHVGKHGDRKVAIVFREVPGEDHMCLVIYPELLPVSMHDGIMRVIDSPEGQAAESLGDALFRSLLPDGRPILQTLHSEGMIKAFDQMRLMVSKYMDPAIAGRDYGSLVSRVERWQSDIATFLQRQGAWKLAFVFGLVIAVATASVRLGARRRDDETKV